MKDDRCLLILAMYIDFVFQEFGSFLRTEVVLVEEDIRLVLDEYNSSFITYEVEPGIYIFKDISRAFSSRANILQTEYELYNNSVDI